MSRRSRKYRNEELSEEEKSKPGININIDFTNKSSIKLIGSGGSMLAAVLIAVFGGEQAYLAVWMIFLAIMIWFDD